MIELVDKLEELPDLDPIMVLLTSK
jgi:hypothetical protein